METRCRIYQFFSKDDIRECGVDKLRLLENPVNSTLRCVMRREQVKKVCVNFKITPNFNVSTSNSGPQILTWNCLVSFKFEFPLILTNFRISPIPKTPLANPPHSFAASKTQKLPTCSRNWSILIRKMPNFYVVPDSYMSTDV